MTNLKVAYNPFNKTFIECCGTHAESLPTASFYDYIRGAIIEGELFLRCFYPFEDLPDIDLLTLYRRSEKYCKEHVQALNIEILNRYNISISAVHYNADKDLKTVGVY
jgi:hypothetical protein